MWGSVGRLFTYLAETLNLSPRKPIIPEPRKQEQGGSNVGGYPWLHRPA